MVKCDYCEKKAIYSDTEINLCLDCLPSCNDNKIKEVKTKLNSEYGKFGERK